MYGKVRVQTTFTEEVSFITSSNPSITDPGFLLLSQIVTGNSSITSINNTIRKEIKFIEIIKAFIRLHKHRGGPLNPSKIDLESEVKGQLPSFRIADLDAEKVTTGTFSLERMPLLDHQSLKNVGLLTHPQLDTFVKTLESNNKELFGEISTSNLLQFIIAAKMIYEDPDSPLYQSGIIVDENMINEFVVIPGITNNDLIDKDNTTADINYEQHYIKGIPPKTGTSFFVNYDTNLAWNSVYSKENLIIVGDTVTLSFSDEEINTTLSLENFESATESSQILSSGNINLFSRETPTILDNANISADSNATNVNQGFYSGKFRHRLSFRSQFIKQFSDPQNWTTYDSFVLDIKCLSLSHGPVYLYFKSSTGDISVNYVLLEQDAITDGFEIRAIDLSEIPFRDKIKSFVIFSDDHISEFSYNIDNIHLERAILLPEQGTMKIRYSTNAIVTFGMIEWVSAEPSSTQINVRSKASNGTVLLNRSEFTNYLNSGDYIGLQGTDIEIEVTFTPDSNRIISPILSSLRLQILTEAEIDGYSIDTNEEFSRGSHSNTKLSGSSVVLQTPIYVDSLYFASGNGISQIHQMSGLSDNTFFNSDSVSLFGTKSPISPNQIFYAVEQNGRLARVSQGQFFLPRSVKRQTSRNFVVADTFNDRILEYNESGNLINGIGSINYEHSGNSVFPISACMDKRTGILYVVWSKKVSFKSVNVSKIIIQSPSQRTNLIRDFDKINGLTTAELNSSNPEGQIMPVYLSSQNAGTIELMPEQQTYLLVDGSVNGVLPNSIDINSVFYKSVVTSLGIPCYVGNFAYIPGIFTPTWCEKTQKDGFVVSNATIAVKNYVFPSEVAEPITRNTNVSTIVEFDKNNNVIFGSSLVEFSPFIPGRVQDIGNNSLLVGGIKSGGTIGELTNNQTLNFRSIDGDIDNRKSQKSILKQLFFGSSNPLVGSVIVIDKSVNSITFQYISAQGLLVSDVDIDNLGQFVLAESSLNKSGRIIKIDSIGNIIFSTGEGSYDLINSIKTQYDGSMVIST